jgi:HAD superfamily hydrolase (TIGR01509 family)
MSIDAIIFDCDGTLVDSVPLANQVLVEYLAELGVTICAREAAAHFGCGRLAQSIADFEKALGYALPVDFAPELRRRRENAVRAGLRPVEGAADLLCELRLPVAVASNGPLGQTLLSLETAGLLQYFARNVFSAYELNTWKPDPGIFLHAAQVLGVHPSRCAVVEDAVPGIEAGIAAGMTVFALCDDDQWQSERVHVIRRLDEIRRYLPGAALQPLEAVAGSRRCPRFA